MTMSNIIKELSRASSTRSLRIDSFALGNSTYNLDSYLCKLDNSSCTSKFISCII